MTHPSMRTTPQYAPDHKSDPAQEQRFIEHMTTRLEARSWPLTFVQEFTVSFAPHSLRFAVLSCEAREVPLLREISAWALSELGVEAAPAEDLLMLIEECISNVVRHSYRADDEKWLSWTIAMDSREAGDAVTFVLEDKGINGRSLPLNERLDSLPASGRPPLRRGGMGLFLIRRMTDCVDYVPGSEERANAFRMLKYLPEE